MKIGLKLWSVNSNYIADAVRLYNERVYDYIELFTVAGSEDLIEKWVKLNIPYILHAPHSLAGLNPSKKELQDDNLKAMETVSEFFLALNPEYTIFHPGLNGTVEETCIQMNLFKSEFPGLFETAILENKPKVGINGEHCIGSSPEEIRKITNDVGIGFCYDIGHSICYSNSSQQNWKDVLNKFMNLKPCMFHVSDGYSDSEKDKHLNFKDGDFDLEYIVTQLPEDCFVSIETNKGSSENLDDFQKDVFLFKELIK